MDNLVREGEQALEGGNNSNQNSGGGFDNQQQQSSGGGGGGLMGGIEKQGEDQMINQGMWCMLA